MNVARSAKIFGRRFYLHIYRPPMSPQLRYALKHCVRIETWRKRKEGGYYLGTIFRLDQYTIWKVERWITKLLRTTVRITVRPVFAVAKLLAAWFVLSVDRALKN